MKKWLLSVSEVRVAQGGHNVPENVIIRRYDLCKV